MEAINAVEKVKDRFAATKSYISELQMEMKRVTWPSKKQVQGTTAVVILTVFAFGAYFAVVDAVLNGSITKLYHVLTR